MATDKRDTPTTDEPTDTERLAREYAQLWNERDYDRIPDLVSESVDVYDPILPGREVHGRDGLEGWIRQTTTSFPEFRGTVLDLLAGEETVMGIVEYVVTEGDEAGEEISFQGMVRLRFEDGQLEEHRGFYDPRKLDDQIDDTEV
ncbi:MAG: nuclear transport factor 2 family protein [Halovenus sp.]